MSVRTTPGSAGGTTSTGARYPHPVAVPFDLTGEDDTAIAAPIGAPPDSDPEPQSRVDQAAGSRSELRAARRQRRRLMVACAVVIAVCVALTVAVVGLARNRPTGSTPLPSAVLSAGAPAVPSPGATIESVPHPSSELRPTSV